VGEALDPDSIDALEYMAKGIEKFFITAK